MNPKYAFFIWTSYALTLAVLLWNVFAPSLRRGQLKRELSEAEDAQTEART
jgi:heme exporter protein CcmD